MAIEGNTVPSIWPIVSSSSFSTFLYRTCHPSCSQRSNATQIVCAKANGTNLLGRTTLFGGVMKEDVCRVSLIKQAGVMHFKVGVFLTDQTFVGLVLILFRHHLNSYSNNKLVTARGCCPLSTTAVCVRHVR